MKVLIVESEFLHQDTWVGNAVERLADALSQQNVTVIKSTSFDDGYAILSANEAIDCLMFSYQMEQPDEHLSVRQLIGKLHERQQNVPVFLLGDREKATASLDRDLLELVDEFAWILEDTADFIAGRAVAAMTRYRQQLLPPLFNALMKYSDIHEYSWAAPGHQGGVGFTKTPAGRFYHDYYGENLFRSDMGIERTTLGSLLDHTGAFGESEKNAARVFGADRSWSVVVGTSGSNRTIMQACMTDNDVVVLDRNCHKSIEQGLILTGAKPVYMVPSRNRYGIIGPIYPQEMQPETLQKKISASPLTKTKAGQKPSYSVVTNCTYDGVCYNAKEAQDLLAKTSDRIHFDEAWYGYARFNPIYCDHYAMRGEPGDHNGPTVFATHSTHKLLNALSQASYIHVREGRGAVNFSRFNQAYMMHATTSPLYAICASNDVAVSMMDGNSGLSLTQEVIDEAVDFRQAMARLYKEFTDEGDWFFKPWNKDLSHLPIWQRNADPLLTATCLTPDIFRVAVRYSAMETQDEIAIERTRSLLFTVLSRFLDHKKFISLLMHMLRSRISDSVYHIIQSDIHKDWNLSAVASCLCLSPSLLKKKLKNENTSYSQIITTCRMRYAVNQLLMDGKNISQVSQLCGYNSTSYFISVFKEFYGMTPLHYVSQHRERSAA